MKLRISIVLLAFLLSPLSAAAIVAGQTDTFESGTTEGWIVALLGAPHPAPPLNIPDGGPQGVGDNFLKITSLGGGGPGSRLAVINVSQWTGDYTAAGIASIGMDLMNLGGTDLTIRLQLVRSMGGPPIDEAVSPSVFLPAGGGWTHVSFAVDAASLTVLNGDVDTLLANVTELRILHSPNPTAPGPAIVAMLGIDNIAAQIADAVPLLDAGAMVLLVFALGMTATLGLRSRAANPS